MCRRERRVSEPGPSASERPRLADWLAQRREDRLVGRETELAVIHSWLRDETVRLVHIVGSAGAGKTALLLTLASRLASERHHVRWVDPEGLATITHDAPLASREPIAIVVFDGLERLPSPRQALEDIIHSLSADARLILSSRGPLPEPFASDPGLWSTLRTLTVGPLSQEPALELAALLGVPPESRALVVARSCGNPLLLSLEAARTGEGAALGPSVEAACLHLLDRLHDPEARDALFVSAILRRVSESLLGAVLGGEGARLLSKVRNVAPLDSTTAGLTLPDALRDALLIELRLRAPEQLHTWARRAQEALLERIASATPEEIKPLVADLGFCCRFEPFASLHGMHLRAAFETGIATTSEQAALRAAIERFEGPESAGYFDRWVEASRVSVLAVRDPLGRVRGGVVYVDFLPDSPAVPEDPFIRALVGRLPLHPPLATGERIRLARFWTDFEHHQHLEKEPYRNPMGPVLQSGLLPGLGTISCAVHWSATDWRDRPEQPVAKYAELETSMGQHFIFGVDTRLETATEVLRRIVQGCRTGKVSPKPMAPGPGDAIQAVGRGLQPPPLHPDADFLETVRASLRAVHRREALESSPLLSLRCVTAAGGGSSDGARAQTLKAILEDIICGFGDTGHDGTLAAVLRATYVGDDRKGVAIAADLAMGHSTYRRWLKRAVSRVAVDLLARERALAGEATCA